MENEEYIKKQNMEDYCIYLCNARNFSIGIWFNGRMHGLRRKFGDEFVDTEHHWDDGAENYGTCKPLKKLSQFTLKDRLHPSFFDVSNWRGQSVIHDMLYAIESLNCVIKENENE